MILESLASSAGHGMPGELFTEIAGLYASHPRGYDVIDRRKDLQPGRPCAVLRKPL